MSNRMVAVLLVLGVVVPTAGTAQSLEDAAAREAARRRQARDSRTYTNKDLPKATPRPKGEGAQASPVQAPEPEGRSEGARADEREPVPGPAGPPAKTEAEWRRAADAARQAVADARAQLKRAEERRGGADKALAPATTLAHKGHPDALFVVLEEAKEAAKEVEEAQTALTAAESALESLESEATDLGIPESWWAAPKSS